MHVVTGAIIAVMFLASGPHASSDVGFGGANSGTTHAGVTGGTEVTVEAQLPGTRAVGTLPAGGTSRSEGNPISGVGDAHPSRHPLTDWASATTDDLGGTAPAPCLRSGTEIPCAAPSPSAPRTPSAPTAGPRIPTLTDIASFRPSSPSLKMEPRSFAIAGRPTNFVASAASQSVAGTLFGLPVTVRFTPASYRFDYGDGTAKTTTTAGSTWKAAAEPLFTRTGTSHVYKHKARVAARVTVAYAAQVSFAGYPGWYDVDGFVTASAPAQNFRVYVAHTVLVEHTCDEDPQGPGCPGTAR